MIGGAKNAAGDLPGFFLVLKRATRQGSHNQRPENADYNHPGGLHLAGCHLSELTPEIIQHDVFVFYTKVFQHLDDRRVHDWGPAHVELTVFRRSEEHTSELQS